MSQKINSKGIMGLFVPGQMEKVKKDLPSSLEKKLEDYANKMGKQFSKEQKDELKRTKRVEASVIQMKKIFGLLAPEAKSKLASMLNSKDLSALKEYLKLLEKDLDKSNVKKVEAGVKNKVISAFKIRKGNKVLSIFNVSDFDWMKYTGTKVKEIPYLGMTLKIDPQNVYGIAKVVDSKGEYKIIIPEYKEVNIFLNKDQVENLRGKSENFLGNLEEIFLKK